MKTLNELAIKYNTDKSNLFHDFCDEYEFFLSKYRNDSIKLLEIGFGSGGSVKMWLEYFNKAIIYSVDINLFQSIDPRHVFICGNQTDSLIYEKIDLFDIIIDDGSHICNDQRITFELLFSKLKSGGIYIVEDVSTSYWTEYGCENLNFIEYTKKFIDEVNYNGMYNDVPVEFNGGGTLKHARSSKYLDETMRKNGLSKKFDIKSIYYGNSFIIFFKK